MEHALVVAFVDGLLALDQFIRTPIRRAVPELDHLLERPADYFSRHSDVRIGPGHRTSIAFVMGLMGGVTGLCVTGLGLQDLPVAQKAVWRPFAVLGSTILGFAVVFSLFRYLFRGGELFLNSKGVIFRHRGADVFCPWQLFATHQPVRRPDRSRAFVPVQPTAASRVAATLHTGAFAEGTEVVTKPFRFRALYPNQKDGPRRADVAVLTDLYRCKLPAVIDLIRTVALRMVVDSKLNSA